MVVLNDLGDIQDGLNILAEGCGGGMSLIFKVPPQRSAKGGGGGKVNFGSQI